MCCTQLTENTVHKKLPKVQHLGTIAQLFCAASSQLRHVLTIEKKNLLKSNISFHKSPKCDELRPTNGWDRFGGLGHPANFNWFVTAATSLTGGQPNLARCLAVFWAATLYIYIYIYIFGSSWPPDGFAKCKVHFTSKSCVLYWLHYSTALQQRASLVSQTLRHGTRNAITELSQRAPPIFGWAAITLGIGTHSSFVNRPEFA